VIRQIADVEGNLLQWIPVVSQKTQNQERERGGREESSKKGM
jgi:hypothetical protein